MVDRYYVKKRREYKMKNAITLRHLYIHKTKLI